MSVAPTIASLDNLSEQEKESEVVLVDHLTVAPEDAERFAAGWEEDVARLGHQPGFVSGPASPRRGRGSGVREHCRLALGARASRGGAPRGARG
jgi:hypothetical protein